MKLEDLRPQDQREFLQAFTANPIVRKLEAEYTRMCREGKFVQAAQARRKVEEIKKIVFDKFIKELDATAERVNLNDTPITQEQRERLNVLCVALFMACDIIDSAVVDIKDTLKAADPELQFVMFDELAQVIQQARAKMQFMNNVSNVAQNVVWGDTSDSMYGMMQNKARSIIRKRNAAGADWNKEFNAMRGNIGGNN